MAYIINQIMPLKNNGQAPFEILVGTKPLIKHPCVFRTLCCVTNITKKFTFMQSKAYISKYFTLIDDTSS